MLLTSSSFAVVMPQSSQFGMDCGVTDIIVFHSRDILISLIKCQNHHQRWRCWSHYRPQNTTMTPSETTRMMTSHKKGDVIIWVLMPMASLSSSSMARCCNLGNLRCRRCLGLSWPVMPQSPLYFMICHYTAVFVLIDILVGAKYTTLKSPNMGL